MVRGLLAALLFCFAPCGGGGDVHFCEYSAIEGPCIPTSGEKIGIYRCFLRMMGGVMGRQHLICRDIRGLWHFSWRSKLSGMLNTPKNARRLEGDLRDKGKRPVEVCIRRGGLCIYPIKDTLRICQNLTVGAWRAASAASKPWRSLNWKMPAKITAGNVWMALL